MALLQLNRGSVVECTVMCCPWWCMSPPASYCWGVANHFSSYWMKYFVNTQRCDRRVMCPHKRLFWRLPSRTCLWERCDIVPSSEGTILRSSEQYLAFRDLLKDLFDPFSLLWSTWKIKTHVFSIKSTINITREFSTWEFICEISTA